MPASTAEAASGSGAAAGAESMGAEQPADGASGAGDAHGEHGPAPAPASASEAAATPKSNRKKRSRRASKGGRNAAADLVGEDINLHVEAGWSEDDKDDKENPAKRIAASSSAGGPAAPAKTDSLLEDFTIRSVVTRKDVDVVFGQDGCRKDGLEGQTRSEISIISGADDPEIVVDRVLSVRGHIDSVAAAYKAIADAMLEHSEKAAPALADSSAEHGQATASGDTAGHAHPEDASVASEGLPTDTVTAASDDKMDAGGAEDGSPGNGKPDGASEDKYADTADKAAAGTRATLRMLVPHKCVGSIMGHGGRTINSIRETADIEIHTSESTLLLSDERIVELVGAPESIQKAIGLVAAALTKDIVAYNSADHYVPAANIPSAMTVETQARKRKDSRRQGPGDRATGSRTQSGRSGGPRNSNGGGNGADGSGYSQGRGYMGSGGGQRAGGGGNVGGGGGSGGMNGGSSGNRGDRFGRSGGPGGRQGGRSRGPGTVSDANRMPVGNSGGGASVSASVGASQQGYSSQYGGGSAGYRGGGQTGGMRPVSTNAMSYAGYAIPAAAAAMYSTYAPQGAVAGGMGAGGPHGGQQYGTGMASMAAAQSVSAYGGAYGAAAAPYQFATPGGYGYAAAPMQSMYGNRAGNPAAAYPPRAYNGYNSRPQMPQQAMGAGAVGAMDAMNQTIQQIYVPRDRIGAVIGRRGETINEIRRVTNARVDIQDSAQGAQERLVVITGAYEQVRTAYGLIKEKVDNARLAGRPNMGPM
ncbi:RNA binding protein, heterogenous nuclear RNP-K like protein [Coemansia biformis]|uniref:RNA binding protein, heterogenous nuclear RNP-K like protein n=1 Tax=Coemansia biformis TaxID=1286918 RepID=A0A9W7Y490_9FUNG|nr:RNA binding protein, heterogenous nuclear RNP-K like protein [Coemansia biformis]